VQAAAAATCDLIFDLHGMQLKMQIWNTSSLSGCMKMLLLRVAGCHCTTQQETCFNCKRVLARLQLCTIMQLALSFTGCGLLACRKIQI
jgi:hypothetical protein